MDKKEMLNRVKVLANTQNLDEDEQKELAQLNAQLGALKAKEDAAKLLAQSEADEAAEREAETERKITEAVKREREKMDAAGRRPAFGDAPYAAKYGDTWKYDTLDATDLSLVIELEKNLGLPVQPAALKAMSLRIAELKDDNSEEGRKAVAYVKGSFKAGTATNIEPTKDAVEAAIKAATDPMYTGGSGIGSDWVGTAYSAELWRSIRAATMVAEKIPSEVIPDGYASKTVPLESTDMTWYKVAEASASDGTLKVPAATIAASQIATANKNITVGKLGARGLYSGEVEEDSLIRFAGQLREQLAASGSEILESLIIDGDVETSANKNINDIAGTPASTDYFLICDGFRKLALVTNTANSRSASGGLSVDDYLDTLKLMGTAGIAGADPTKAAFIIDGNVYYAMAKLPELKTKDVASAATIENGFVTRIWNVGVIPSWQMHRASAVRKANTAGKVDVDTTGNNTTGAILAVRWDQWKQAYKRRMTMEVTRIANADSYEIVALMRWGLGYRDNEASAITYNVGV